jgi:uncharacterized SAM-binding protein YcdF (DUF218 family)
LKSKWWLFAASLCFLLGFLIQRSFQETKLIEYERVNLWLQNPKADCAVVLTGGSHRIRQGIDLLYSGRVGRVIISGVNQNATYEEIFPQGYFYQAVDSKNIILEKKSLTTYGNAAQSFPLAEALQCRSILLVTSFVHMPRAYRVFLAQAPKYIEVLKHSVMPQVEEFGFFDLQTEVLKSLFYSVWAY